MYKLKKIPEDFIVQEVTNRKCEGGNYALFLLKKTNYNTEDAVFKIAEILKVQRKNISYAGAKDKKAITSQYITIMNSSNKNIELKDINLEYVGNTTKPLSLGDLEGNKFKITLRNIQDEKIKKIDFFNNYFDEQRFSKNNAEIGKAIIKKEYARACKILIEENSKFSQEMKNVLEKHKNSYLNALKVIPRKILMLYVHAYQSLIWNKIVTFLDDKKINIENVPLAGFDVEPEDNIKEIYEEILNQEGITPRDFILRDFPEISLEGTNRKVKAEIKNLIVSEFEDDELNLGKKKVVVEFFLGKGSYATMAIKHMVI